jgi:hypothetical protein
MMIIKIVLFALAILSYYYDILLSIFLFSIAALFTILYTNKKYKVEEEYDM